jgi:acetyl-CoA carboxylase biotin carboxylase subunit
MDAILQAAEQTACQAIHPGYGFLSENALFAARCEAQKLAFIGPPPHVIRLLGDKVHARRAMSAAGAQAIPGSEGVLADVEAAGRAASAVGYPVFLKAAAGGGGRGMRRCADEASLRRGFAEARLEAEKAFGNGDLYLEKAIEGGRHIEFQILVDTWGQAVHLGERECSVQRRHQKLIEESPSAAVEPDQRERIGSRLAEAAASLGYRGAGTMELLRDRDGTLFFMETNARLQVEHPVTEEVTGRDIVAAQLRIAAGEPLGLRQSQIKMKGHAIEFRINAEDPDADFRPSPGTITRFEPPAGVRVETHIPSGEPRYRVPAHYDSLIAKMIVHGRGRAETIRKAAAALAAFRIEGVKTTLPLHQRVLALPEFLSGDYDLTILEKMLQVT